MERSFSTQFVSDGVVLIGKKPLMNYVLACLTLFNSGKPYVTVRARGVAIFRAVDTVQLLRKAFLKNLSVEKISIGTQEFKMPGNIDGSTSTIEIVISKSNSNNLNTSTG